MITFRDSRLLLGMCKYIEPRITGRLTNKCSFSWPEYNILGRCLLVTFLIICHFVVVYVFHGGPTGDFTDRF